MSVRIIRPLRFDGDIAIVPLTRGYEAIIDAADACLIQHANWCVWTDGRVFYARTNTAIPGVRSIANMHTVILTPPDGFEVDHRDGDGLNNRRSNLRVASHAQNNWNKGPKSNSRSGLKGIWFHAATGKWRASIRANGKTTDLGLHTTPEEAHAAYQVAAARIHGQFARFA
jgi:uncharacterized Fe-S cluster protein YjdI